MLFFPYVTREDTPKEDKGSLIKEQLRRYGKGGRNQQGMVKLLMTGSLGGIKPRGMGKRALSGIQEKL